MTAIAKTFKGVRFRRYPEAKQRADRVYFKCSADGTTVNDESYLHRAVYVEYNGSIPEGHHIHHIDGDPLNNDPSNLEAVEASRHISQHSIEWHKENPEFAREHIEANREAINAWHRSPEGREWHRRRAIEIAENRGIEEKACEQCGDLYETPEGQPSRFCSDACKAKARRESGVDDEERECRICGDAFTTNKYSGSKTCSRSCGAKLGHINKRKPQR